MCLFRNGCRFEIDGIAVSVPENYCICPDVECCFENALFFVPPDGSFRVSYEMHSDCMGTKETLLQVQSQIETLHKAGTVEEIEVNGLKGHCFTYGGKVDQYFEARFSVDKESGTEFAFTIHTENHDIESIMASPQFNKLLYGIGKAY